MAQSGAIVDAAYSVPQGTVNRVPAGNYALLVEQFAMGDGSRIEISEETPLFVIRAKNATVGNDTAIIGIGRDGRSGEDGIGEEGQPGANGPTIVLVAEQQGIQGLNIRGLYTVLPKPCLISFFRLFLLFLL